MYKVPERLAASQGGVNAQLGEARRQPVPLGGAQGHGGDCWLWLMLYVHGRVNVRSSGVWVSFRRQGPRAPRER